MESFLLNYGTELLVKTGEHLFISFISLLLGVIVAVPLGILLSRTKRIAGFIMGIASLLQTIPSLAFLALMVPFLGVGKLPAIVALFIYSLLPILRNTYIGMNNVNTDLVDAAKGMGMTSRQQILLVEIPNALPTIMAGVKLASVYVIAWATLASYIGAGGLGDFIFSGLNNYLPALIIGGTIPVTLLALITDYFFAKLEEKLTPVIENEVV
ncbi:ABC transporter permease [Vagococcus xieshaowenii]|uniref:ABC transporter permease n=1 Tax=Vagococcus xieshaowenii TaxID=2562451 RepID=A0AAJ5JM10_9ENTE|nr:ABC transporter permease [Vagococcus xieshaowenii]QCA28079.1 ABC transporter permease [Vagococcus xieshaowenii]TFZ40122.1 ABC transporter permease [Vagococcus xieshaowenii]